MVSGSEPRGAAGAGGFGIFARNQLARWFGVAVAAVNLIAALTSIEASPFWALVIVGIDVLVIYGLAAYGDRLERPRECSGLKQNAEHPRVRATRRHRLRDAAPGVLTGTGYETPSTMRRSRSAPSPSTRSASW
jgi:hypothetical protein